MKQYLLPNQGVFYKANLHCHTTMSDGHMTPDETKQAYMDQGYSIVAFTDHEILFPQNHLTDDNFLALNGVEHDIDEKERFDRTGKKCHFCCIALEADNHLTPCPDESKFQKFQGNLDNVHLYKPQPGTEFFPRAYDPKTISALMQEIKKYGFLDEFIFAVGDGNHSLSTAKTHWENVKKTLTEKERENHPARYAVCEFVNIYDEGIYFEPIHRFIKGVNVEDFTLKLQSANVGNITVFDGNNDIVLTKNSSLPDTIKALDAFIKDYIEKFGGEIDYVHGEENVRNLVKTQNGVGVFLDKLDKSELFKYVSKNGALPRKTFSMGENIEKRYYLEGSIIAND